MWNVTVIQVVIVDFLFIILLKFYWLTSFIVNAMVAINLFDWFNQFMVGYAIMQVFIA